MRKTLIPACLTALVISTLGAQQVMRKDPAVFAGTDRTSRVEVRPPGLRLGLRHPREVALAPLSETEVAQLTGPGTRPKAGIQRKLVPHAAAAGTWETTTEGARVWRMAIRSPGSYALRVEFDNFDAGDGRVWLHDGAAVDGPYSGEGPFGNGHFWSGTIFSESATLEYEPAAGRAAELEPPFQVPSIMHQRRSPLEPGTAPLDAAAGKKDPADYCELDVNCYPEWRGTMSAVGQITFVDGPYAYFCSGSLVATRDNSFKPYFLTAGHCVNTEEAARTVEAYWTYQTAACAATPPADRSASTRSTGGAHLIASGGAADGDFSLILLANVPSGVTFSGWDTGDPPLSTPLTGIHHPSASWKRISFGQRSSDAVASVDGAIAPGYLYLQVLWNNGRVEHGSSGSPLFSAPGVIVGSLSYGSVSEDGTVCRINPSFAGYSRFSNTYTHVKDFLENYPADLVVPEKTSLTFTSANHNSPAGQAIRLTTQATAQIAYKLRADASWIKLSASTGSVAASTPASVTVSADTSILTQPGTYKGTVTIFSGAAAPQFLNVTATIAVDQSNVAASVSPNPVVQTDGVWSFQIKLLETAGVATHLTALKLNGQDYTADMAAWFGTTRIGAGSVIVAPLSARGVFPSGDQYFEFYGVDDASGQSWYRVATVTFR